MLRYAMLRYDMCSYTLGEMGDYEMKGKKDKLFLLLSYVCCFLIL